MKLTSREVRRRPLRVVAAVVVAGGTLSAVALTRDGEAQAVPATGTSPVAYVTTNTPTVGAFQLSALGSEAGGISVPASQNEATEVAIAPDDSAVVTVAGDTLNISPISGTSYVAPANSAPSTTLSFSGYQGYGLAVSPDGRFAYTIVDFDAGDSLVKVDLHSGTVVSSFSLFNQGVSMDALALEDVPLGVELGDGPERLSYAAVSWSEA